MRAVWALDGVDWRGWTAADRAAVTYVMLKRQHSSDPQALRELYEMVGDTAALATLDRSIMGQTKTIQTDR